jgi:hypothetical protein
VGVVVVVGIATRRTLVLVVLVVLVEDKEAVLFTVIALMVA